MSEDTDRALLLETARSELNRAHQGALTMQAGEIRRALEAAAKALHDLASPAASRIDQALADLDNGKLVELETLVEQVRTELEA